MDEARQWDIGWRRRREEDDDFCTMNAEEWEKRGIERDEKTKR